MTLRIIEAIMSHNARNEKQVTLLDLATVIWKDANDAARQVNISKLANGHIKRVEPEVILTICDFCDVSLPFLFGRNLQESESVENLQKIKAIEKQEYTVSFNVADKDQEVLVSKSFRLDMAKFKKS